MDNYITQFLNHLSVKNFSPRTVEAYKHDLNKFVEFLESISKSNFSAVSSDDIGHFLSQLKSTGIKKPNSAITMARKLAAIKSFFKWAARRKILKENPAADVDTPKIPEREPTYLTQEEYERLLAIVKLKATPFYCLRDLAIVNTFLGTGVRLSELVGLKLGNVSLQESQESILVKGKGNKERTIPLNENVSSALEKYLKKRPDVESDFLFISRLGDGLSTGGVYHLIKRYLKEAGIKKDKVGVHSLRHTFATSLLNNKNVNIIHIQQLLGHKKIETTRRYLHINNIDLRNAVNSLVLSKK
jgi:site-specific recombinase XerD